MPASEGGGHPAEAVIRFSCVARLISEMFGGRQCTSPSMNRVPGVG